MKRIPVIGTALALATVAALAAPAVALMRDVPLDEMVSTADAIVRARVVSLESRWADGNQTIRTQVVLDLSESWKGAYGADRRLVIEVPGGKVGDVRLQVEDQPDLRPGDDVVLFLHATSDARLTVHNAVQGAYAVSGNAIVGPRHDVHDLTGFRNAVRAFAQSRGR